MLTTVAVVLALVAAALDAVASVAQQRVAFRVPQADARGVRLLARLTRSPSWLAGVASNAGICYGVIAAPTKSVVSLVDNGVFALLTSWELYALAMSAVGAVLLQQSAFQAGHLEASLPAMTVAEPLVAVTLGIVVLQEQVRADGLEWLLIGMLVVVMASATAALARSAARFEPAPTPQA